MVVVQKNGGREGVERKSRAFRLKQDKKEAVIPKVKIMTGLGVWYLLGSRRNYQLF